MKLHLIPLLLFVSSVVFGQGNPFVRDIHTADPSAHVWEDGRLYVYPSHDISPPSGCDRMDKYHVYSTDDMINWVDHGQILEAKDVPWDVPITNASSGATFMWAPDCACKDGKYYFYFPHPAGPTWNDTWQIGIAISDKPAGDFAVQDRPLIGIPEKGGCIDPCVFIDDNGQAYFYYGGGNSCFGGKLKDNMIELDGELQPMTGLYDFHEAAWVFKRNGIYYLTYADNNSGANQLRYAVSDNPLGPWSHKGAYLQPTTCDTSHGSVVEYKGQWWAFYHTADLSGTGLLRSICVDPLFFNEDGTIQTVVQTKDMGSPYLGIMRNTNGTIEAEDFNSGGQGIAYWSNKQGYNPGTLRKNEAIVIQENRRNGIYYVTNTSEKEYINYTFEALEDGVYTIDFTIGSVNQNREARFYIEFDWYKNSNLRRHTAPYASVSDLPTVTVQDIMLSKGIHTLNFYPLGNLNFDKFTFKKYTPIEKINKEEIAVYPNPSDGLFQILTPIIGIITIRDMNGNCIFEEKMKDLGHTVDISTSSPGIYILTIQSGNLIYQCKIIKK